ncbi:MAG: 5' nucleotidase, NT5C type [Desulfitobacteriaceae bacterium]
MRIGVDIDGVIADSYSVWLHELNRHYGKNIPVLEDYDIHLVFDVPWDDMNDFFKQNTEQLFSMPQPMQGAKEGLETLLDDGHEVIYITARVPEEKEVTLRWLQKYQIPYEHILFVGDNSKVDIIKQWEMHVFVEDYLVNAKSIAQSGVPALLLNASYNQGQLPAGITRCHSWQEILQEISRLELILKLTSNEHLR